MNAAKFLQIHYLTAYPASLLNRDDAGMAKRIPFGGTSRTRISSQCLKRHWRNADGDKSLRSIGIDMSIRSRGIFEELVARPLIAEGLDEPTLRSVVKAVQSHVLGESAKKAKKEAQAAETESPTDLETGQVIVLGSPEIEFIKATCRDLCGGVQKKKDGVKAAVDAFFKDKKKVENLKALEKASGLDAAVFGRMVTSDYLAKGEAAVHVAHAFTVHAEEAESDYFSAVDDLVAAAGELGAGHINETELTSGLYYGYVVVDVPLLVSNLEGVKRQDWMSADRTLVAKVVESLIHTIATVSPGAKLGSTAPYASALLVLLEAGSRQPRTLANAYLEPVDPRAPEGLVARTVRAMADHLTDYDKMYGQHEVRAFASMVKDAKLPAEDVGSLQAVAETAAKFVREG